MVRMLDEGGKLIGSPGGAMNQVEIAEAMRWMLLSRAIDGRITRLQRMGRAGVYGPVEGQEATVVGSAMALDPSRDWIVPASREQPAMVRHGLPLDRLFAGYMGRLNHARIPDGVRLLPRQSSIATQIPHAVGLAWGMKLRHERSVVMVYFGEGAASEGDYHEACNLAGVMRVPIVFVLINNQWAISTPAPKQSAAADLASRAAGYGFPGALVDGNDIFAVQAVAVKAVQRALDGGGPTLIEARTYRIGFHNTSDNPRQYRTPADEDEARKRDPIQRLRTYALEHGCWSREQEEQVQADIDREVQAAYEICTNLPAPEPDDLFEHIYAELPPRVAAQRQSLRDGSS